MGQDEVGMLNATNQGVYQAGQNQLGMQRLTMEEEAQRYGQSEPARQHQLQMAGLDNGQSMSPAESFATSNDFANQPPENQSRSIDWGGNAIRQDPSRAREISDLVGASDEQLVRDYRDAFVSPNLLMESNAEGDIMKTKIENRGLMLDARGVPRPPGLERQLPWAQEFLGFGYADPAFTGRTLSDLQRPVAR